MANTETKLHAAVADAGRTLKELHRELVEVTKEHYEKKFGRVSSPGELLRLLLNHPEFGWLHAMSELMVDIDELLVHPEISPLDAAAVRSEISKLVTPPELDSSDFYRKYKEALQVPEVAVSHGKLRKVLAELPEPEPEDIAEVMRARHKWAEKNRQRSRRVQ
ncbi:MAG TPA: hypothetical protein VKW78_13660 [Terriglobales bacterium]|nr:hypothetical protein [Terriglobales bacterium]